jgi:predicted transcriptional regulator
MSSDGHVDIPLKARRLFLEGLPYRSPAEAIAAGARSTDDWCRLLDRLHLEKQGVEFHENGLPVITELPHKGAHIVLARERPRECVPEPQSPAPRATANQGEPGSPAPTPRRLPPAGGEKGRKRMFDPERSPLAMRALRQLASGEMNFSRLAVACSTNTPTLRPILDKLEAVGLLSVRGAGGVKDPRTYTLTSAGLEWIRSAAAQELSPWEVLTSAQPPEDRAVDPQAEEVREEGARLLNDPPLTVHDAVVIHPDGRREQVLGIPLAPESTTPAPIVKTIRLDSEPLANPASAATPAPAPSRRDPEVAALEDVLAALEGLPVDGCRRVLEFAGDRLVSRELRSRGAA